MDVIEHLKINQKTDRYANRLNSLERKGWNISHIKKGVDSAIKNLDSGAKSLVIYGEPQSGKTEVMIALTCALLDSGIKTIFIVMNDNTELENQNFKRFKATAELNQTPFRALEFVDLKDEDKKLDIQRIIFCRKNYNNLENLITECRFLKDRVVVDDEADYASPDTKINKKGGQKSAINDLVGQLGKLDQDGRYIGVTATPGRLDLNNTFLNRTEDWVFLDSHENYVGRSFFFPISDSDKAKSKFILERQPEDGDDPKLLEHSFLRFVTKVAILNLQRHSLDDHQCYSMLIHTAGTKLAHKKDKQDLEGFIHNFTAQKVNKLQSYCNFISDYASNLNNKNLHGIEPDDICRYVLDNIGRRSILVINSNNDKANVEASCDPSDLFTFAIGGNIVSRGLTFNNLLTFFFSRNVKGKLQQNTYVQRARMFGTRPYANWFELCIPDSLYEDWATCFADHELSIQSAIAGDASHFSSKRTASSDPSAIDDKNVIRHSGEFALSAIFDMDEPLIQQLKAIKDRPISGIRLLIKNGMIPDYAVSMGILNYIDKMSGESDKDSAIIAIEKTFFYCGGNLNSETLMRDRGGLIASVIKGRKQYLDKVHLLLITSDRLGRGRIIYRSNAGKRILKNVIEI